MIAFLGLPLYNFWLGIVLPLHVIFMTLGSAIVFGFFGTRQLMKYEEETKLEISIKDKFLKIACPKCNDRGLVELTSPRENFIYNSYKGLVYCTHCDFELSKDEFDREYRPNG